MTVQIRESLYLIAKEYADKLEIGSTHRKKHDDCPAGEDTKRRLYLTRKADICLAYCHHCGNSGAYYVDKNDRYRTSLADAARITVANHPPMSEFTVPILLDFDDLENVPVEAQVWRYKTGVLTQTECQKYGIRYSPDYNAIYLPFIPMEGHVNNGYQLRPLHKKGGAKYINFVKDSNIELGGVLIVDKSSTIVIVEDYISGVRIHQAGYDVLVNYGTAVKPKVLHTLAQRGYDKIVVWLDNDNEVVVDSAKQMKAVLETFGQNVERVATLSDPKHYTEDKIQGILGVPAWTS